MGSSQKYYSSSKSASLDKETKDGWGKNVQRLKSFPSNRKQADIAKVTGALKALLKLEEALTTEEENLSKRLVLLYDKNNIIKPWEKK